MGNYQMIGAIIALGVWNNYFIDIFDGWWEGHRIGLITLGFALFILVMMYIWPVLLFVPVIGFVNEFGNLGEKPSTHTDTIYFEERKQDENGQPREEIGGSPLSGRTS